MSHGFQLTITIGLGTNDTNIRGARLDLPLALGNVQPLKGKYLFHLLHLFYI